MLLKVIVVALLAATAGEKPIPIPIPEVSARELRAQYEIVLAAEQARDLAQKEYEAKLNAWRAEHNALIGMRFKLMHELEIPKGWQLAPSLNRFEPPPKPATKPSQSGSNAPH